MSSHRPTAPPGRVRLIHVPPAAVTTATYDVRLPSPVLHCSVSMEDDLSPQRDSAVSSAEIPLPVSHPITGQSTHYKLYSSNNMAADDSCIKSYNHISVCKLEIEIIPITQ